MQGISWLAEELLACKEGLCPLESVGRSVSQSVSQFSSDFIVRIVQIYFSAGFLLFFLTFAFDNETILNFFFPKNLNANSW